jgi:hypothetical protein
MSLFEIIIHLILWPFNTALYTYNTLAFVIGSEPPFNVVGGASLVALLLGLVLAWRCVAIPTSATSR